MAKKSATLRQDEISKGRISLYIQYYPPIRNPRTMKMVQRETLNIYLHKNPADDIERKHNEDMMVKAKTIHAQRVQSIVNDEYDFFDKHLLDEDFLKYYYEYVKTKPGKWLYVFQHFIRFVDGKCSFKEVTVDLCRRFGEYLLNDATQLENSNVKLKTNSAAGYFSTFRAMLKIAYREKRLKENVNDYIEKIQWEQTKREYLTFDEVQKLIDTPCDIPVLKYASMFSIMTGLRISDILQLEWEHIVNLPRLGWSIRMVTQKTKTQANLPISDEALEWCGKRTTGRVFKNLQRSMVQFPLQRWIKEAGIEKHITFHCFRHTFAALQLSSGEDIYTVSKMLTHKHVSTTEIYADLVSEKKVKSANRISFKKKG